MNTRTALLRTAFLTVVLALGGCASMSADECLSADWRTVGYEDGQQGSLGRIGDYRKDCSKVGITPDLDAYEQGRTEGLRRYCVPRRGFDVGSSGGRYQGQCPADLEAGFVEALEDGRTLYGFTQEVERLESLINDVERDLDDDEDTLRELEQTLIDAPGDAENRRRLLEDIKDRTRSAEAHRIELVELSRDLDYAERDLEDYRELLGDGYR